MTLKAGFIPFAPSCKIFIVGAPSVPTTINLAPGAVVPTPTLPSSFTLKAGFVGVAPSCNTFKVGAPSVPTTINLAPGVVVPTPTLALSFTCKAGVPSAFTIFIAAVSSVFVPP